MGSLSQKNPNKNIDAEDVFIEQGVIGKQLEILQDKTTKISDPTQNCPNFRYVCTKHAYTGQNHDAIYYHIYQCIQHDGETVDAERVYFSYTEKGRKYDLPKGCPPPSPEKPKKKDPCQMGYDIGQTISETVSNLIVPQLMEDDSANPENETPQFQEILKLKTEFEQTSDLSEFNEDQKAAISAYEKLIEDFAKEKIKCFTENVIPNKKVDIEIICAEQGAYETIKEALQSVLKDEINCGAIGCTQIAEAFKNGETMVHRLSLDIDENATDDWKVVAGESNFQEGVEDFNGNLQLPEHGETYMIQTAFIRQSRVQALKWTGDEVVFVNRCSENDDSQRFTFEKQLGFYRMKNVGSDLYLGLRKGRMSYVALTDNNDPSILWRIVINPDGSITFLNKATTTKTIGATKNKRNLNIRVFNKYERLERFLIRNECTNEVAFTRDMETQAFGIGREDAVIDNAESDLNFGA